VRGALALVHATCTSHGTDAGMLLLFIAACKLKHFQQDAWLTVQRALQLAVTQMLPSFIAKHPEVSLGNIALQIHEMGFRTTAL